MKRDLPAVIRKTADFLNKTISPDQVSKLAEHLSFKKMKDNKMDLKTKKKTKKRRKSK